MNNKGFTICEIIAVLVIVSVLFAFAMPKFIDFDANAEKTVIHFQDKAEERQDFQMDLVEKMK